MDVDGVEVLYFQHHELFQPVGALLPYLGQSLGFLYAPSTAPHLERQVPTVDLVHSHIPFTYSTWAGCRAARRHGKPVFYHQRGVFDPARLRFRSLKKRAFIEAIEKPTMRAATTLVALTDAEVASYRALGMTTPCHVVPDGIDVRVYEGGSAGPASAGTFRRAPR